MRSWRDSSAFKRASCSYREARFGSRHLHWVTHNHLLTLALWNLIPSSGLHRYCIHISKPIHRHICAIKKIKIKYFWRQQENKASKHPGGSKVNHSLLKPFTNQLTPQHWPELWQNICHSSVFTRGKKEPCDPNPRKRDHKTNVPTGSTCYLTDFTSKKLFSTSLWC